MTGQTDNSINLNTAPQRGKCPAGFALTEFLIATLILFIIASAVFRMLAETQRAAGYQAEVQSVLNNTRIAFETIERYIRQAGNDPLQSGLCGMDIVSSTEVQIRSDRTGSSGAGKGDPDGDIDDSWEDITIRHNPGSQSLEVVPHGGSAQIVANYISDLSMEYYDAQGNPTDSGNQVRRITVTISGSTLHPNPNTHETFGVKLSETIRVRT